MNDLKLSDVLKYILVFFTLGKNYTRGIVEGGGILYTDNGNGDIEINVEVTTGSDTYTDDGNGNITITAKED